MPDRIWIRDLRLRAKIGTRPDERTTPQEIVVTLALETDLSGAAVSDDLAQAVDYQALVERIAAHVSDSSFQLIEALASSIADVALENPRLAAVTVTLDKPGALPNACVGVEIRRIR